MLNMQDFKCPICTCDLSIKDGDLIPNFGHGAHIDHCHITEDVRGILCRKCNLGLGNFNDNTSALERAIVYLESAKFRHEVMVAAGLLM